MKVAILIANHYTCAVWTDPRVEKQAKALLAAGHDVVVLATGKNGETLPRNETKDGIHIIRCLSPLQRLYNRAYRRDSAESQPPQTEDEKKTGIGLIDRFLMLRHNLNLLYFYFAAVLEAMRQRADVYVGHDLTGLRPAYVAARLTGARVAYDSRELWVERTRSAPYRSWQKRFVAWQEKLLSRRCDLVIVVSQSTGEILAKRYNIPQPMLIPNVQPFTEAVPSAEMRKRLNGGTDRRIAVFVGFFDPGRGVEQLVEAARYLDDTTCFALLGDGVLRPELEARAKNDNLGERVRFIGWVTPDELPQYLASADLGVSPMSPNASRNNYYSLDNKSFQYIMAGLPLIVNEQPEKRRLVEQYQIGIVFDETDPRDIARAIQSALADPVRYEQMRANCLKVAREELNWDIMSKRYVTAIEALVARNPNIPPGRRAT